VDQGISVVIPFWPYCLHLRNI